MIKMTTGLLNDVSDKARASSRRRCNYNFHKTYSEPVQRMLNAAEPGTYIRPHRHEDPAKTEVFLILRGRVVVVEFDMHGHIIDHVVMDAASDEKMVEIPPHVWHTFIVLSAGSVLYEIKEGPYEAIRDKDFAAWAPAEGAPEAAGYNERILKDLGLSII